MAKPTRPSRLRKLRALLSRDKLSSYNRDKIDYYAKRAAFRRNHGSGEDNPERASRWERHRLDRAVRSVHDPLTTSADRQHALDHIARSLIAPVDERAPAWSVALEALLVDFDAQPTMKRAQQLEAVGDLLRTHALADIRETASGPGRYAQHGLDSAGLDRIDALLSKHGPALNQAVSAAVRDNAVLDGDTSGVLAAYVPVLELGGGEGMDEPPMFLDIYTENLAGPTRALGAYKHEMGAIRKFWDHLLPTHDPEATDYEAWVENLTGPLKVTIALPFAVAAGLLSGARNTFSALRRRNSR